MDIPTQGIEWWLKSGLIYGLGFIAIAGLLGIFLWAMGFGAKECVGILRAFRQWIPVMAKSHLEFVDTTKRNSERTATAVEKLTETHGVSTNHHRRTHRTMGKILEAAKHAAKHANMGEVHDLLEEAERELDSP